MMMKGNSDMRTYVKPSLAVLLLLVWSTLNAPAQFTFGHVGGGPTGTFTPNGGGSYTLVGGGNDIWDGGDEFSFAYTQITGDFDISVRMESIETANRWTKAGLMARESLNPDSRMAFAKATPSGPSAGNTACGEDINGAADVSLMYRTWKTDAGSNGGQHEDRLTPDPGWPTYKWLRLQREGNIIRGYTSLDGSTWQSPQVQDTATWLTPVGGAPTPLAQTLYVGFGVSRHGCAVVQSARAEYRDLQQAQIKSQPQSATVAKTFAANFNIGLAGLANWTVQWYRNGASSLAPPAGLTPSHPYRWRTTMPAFRRSPPTRSVAESSIAPKQCSR
jgi:hypothetical protein